MNEQVVLTAKEMKHLEILGLDINDASMVRLYSIEKPEFGGMNLRTEDVMKQPNLLTREVCLFCSYRYDFHDVYNKLPASIGEGEDAFNLILNKAAGSLEYVNSKSSTLKHITIEDGDLLHAAYQMLVWCVESGHVKKTTKRKEVLNRESWKATLAVQGREDLLKMLDFWAMND